MISIHNIISMLNIQTGEGLSKAESGVTFSMTREGPMVLYEPM
jgi:hypothetical protein